MTDLTKLTLAQAKAGVIKKDFSSKEITKAFISKMEAGRHLNAYITELPEQAMKQAEASDARIANGEQGRLEGMPLGIKDLFCTKGIRTTAASKILDNFVPSYESTVTQNLLNAGAVFLGKTNMDEFAMGSANLTSAYGPCVNPWKSKNNPDAKIVPGGSSGGSVAAVAGHLALAATASDTGGSIRQPAAFCGLVGIKPTYGLCSRWGMVAFASSLDQAGPVAHTVTDAALMLSVMASYDEKDATSLNVKIPHYDEQLSSNIKGLRVGIAKEYTDGLSDEMAALFNKGVQWLKDAGAEVKEVSLKMTKYALPAYYIIAPAEASSNLARYDGIRYGVRAEGKNLNEVYENTRRQGFGDEVRRRIMIGTYVLSAGYYDAYYNRAQKVRRLIESDFNEAFKNVDVILTPTTPGAAFSMDECPSDPVIMYLNDIFTVTVNMAGLPGISVPVGLSQDGLPLGLQFIGPKFSEQTLFNASLVLEQSSNFLAQVPDYV